MERTLPDRAHPAPVPVTASRPTAARRQALRTLWDQSWGKSVGDITTILGTEPQPTGHAIPPTRTVRHLFDQVEACPAGVRVVDAPSADVPDRIATAAAAAVLTRRISAADRYVLHRAYPSPRSLFGVDLEHHHADGGRSLVLPWDSAVLPLGDDAASEPRRPGLLLRVRPNRYPAPYGELRPALTRLEAGHLAATVAVVAEHLGLELATVLGGRSGRAAHLTPDEPQGEGLTLPERSVAALVRASLSGAEVDSLGAWFARRTSGPSGANLVTSQEPGPGAAERLDAVVCHALRAVASLCPPGALTVHRTTLRGRGMTDRSVAELTSDGPRATRVLDARASWSSALGYTWSIDPLRWQQEHGELSTEAVHVLLGWLCQWVCLAAAAHGLAARPMRNIDEALWAQDLQLGGRAMPGYQVWIRPLTTYDRATAAWTNQGRPA